MTEPDDKERAHNIYIARNSYDALKKGVDVDGNLREIIDFLKRAHADESALDPEGKKSAQQMQKELAAAVKPARILEARRSLEFLKSGKSEYATPRDTDSAIAIITYDLKEAGVDESALDPEGKKSAVQMKAEVQEATKTSYIREARKDFEGLKDISKENIVKVAPSPAYEEDSVAYAQNATKGLYPKTREDFQHIDEHATIGYALKGIAENLKKAHADEAALDPEGKKPAGQMKTEIQAAVKAAHITVARENYEYIKTLDLNGIPLHSWDNISVNNHIKQIYTSLQHAGADEAVLDPKGQKIAADIKAELAGYANSKYSNIYEARAILSAIQYDRDVTVVNDHGVYGKLLTKPEELKQNALKGKELIYKYLEKAGTDESALDPDGMKTAEQMKTELEKLIKEKSEHAQLPVLDDKMKLALAQYRESSTTNAGGGLASIPFPIDKTSGRGAA